MDLQAGDLATVYGKTLEEVRQTQLDIIGSLGDIRLSSDNTRKAIESVTSSLMFLDKTGVLPLQEGWAAASEMSQQFGSGTAQAAKEAAKALEVLAHIPDVISSRLEKAENRVVRFSATNRKDFLKSVMDLNKQYGHQNTILKAIGSTFAGLAVEARKYGASADTATEIAQGFSGALLSNSEDTVLSIESGMKLAKLLSSPQGLAKIQESMNPEQLERFKEMLPTIMEEAKEGSALAFSDISNMLSGTMQDMVGRLESLKTRAGSGLSLSTAQRVMSSFGVNVKSPEGRALAAQLLRSKGTEDLQRIVSNIMKSKETTEKEAIKGKKEKEVVIAGTGPIANLGNTLTNIEKYLQIELGKNLIDFTGKVIGWIQKNPTTALIGGLSGGVGLAATWIVGSKILSTAIKNAFSKGSAEVAEQVVKVGAKAGEVVEDAVEATSKTAGRVVEEAGEAVVKSKGVLAEVSERGLTKLPGAAERGLETARGLGGKGGKLGAGLTLAAALADAIYAGYEGVKGTKNEKEVAEVVKKALARLFEEKKGEAGLTMSEMRTQFTGDLAKLYEEEKNRGGGNVPKFAPSAESTRPTVALPQMNITSSPGAARTAASSVNASNIVVNPDGSATVKTIVTLDQTIPGFSSAVTQVNADVARGRRIGGL